jgi:protein translocase SecG subunit
MAEAPITYEAWLAIEITLLVLMSISALYIIFVILMQLGNSDLGAVGGQDSTENYFGKHKSRSFDSRLKRGTVYAGIFFVLFSIGFFVLKIIQETLI